MILVDTSVRIEHLRRPVQALIDLLLEGNVACYPFIVGELAGGPLRQRREILPLPGRLANTGILTHSEARTLIEEHSLMGSGIGSIDVHLLGSTWLTDVELWTMDRKLALAATEVGVRAALYKRV